MLAPGRWAELSPYLDEVLALPQGERAAWIETLRTSQPALAAELAGLLAAHHVLVAESFLESKPPPLPVAASLERTLGAYTLERELGRGGMGVVWLARRSDGRFERQVAIKFLQLAFAGQDAEERFKLEGSILGRLAHPNIAELIDAGVSAAGHPYLILEYVEGEAIDSYCDRLALPVEARVRLFLDVLAAVAHAHSNLIVHRDLKPSNILVTATGQVKLLDFGIARLLETPAALLTADASRFLTPAFAAPEQLRNGPITTGTDIYSLGVLLFLLLTGQHPARGALQSPADLVHAIVEIEAPRASDAIALDAAVQRSVTPEKLRRLLRGDLDLILGKALKKEPTARYLSVSAFAEDLQRYLGNQPITVRRDTARYRIGKFVRRNRLAVALACLTILTLLAGIAGILAQTFNARRQRNFALREAGRSAVLNEFHEFLLSDAGPSGTPLTVGQLLDRAERIVARQHNLNDANRLELLVSIGGQYAVADMDVKARPLLEEAYRLSRRSPDLSLRASAACAFAVTLARDEEVERAENIYRKAIAEFPDTPEFALDRSGCLGNGADISLQRSDVNEAIKRAAAAQQVLQKSPFDSDAHELDSWIELAQAYSFGDQNLAAEHAFEHAGQLLTRLGRDETATAGRLFGGWALQLDQMGRILEAEALFRRVIGISRKAESTVAVSPVTLVSYAHTLRELHRLDEAAANAEAAYRDAERNHHELAINQALLELGRIYTAQHQTRRASAALDQVEPRLRASLPPHHYAFAGLAYARAGVQFEEGNLPAARRFIDEALTLEDAAIRAGTEAGIIRASILLFRARCELASGQAGAAERDSSDALKDWQRRQPSAGYSSRAGAAWLALANALAAEGKRSEAQAAYATAAANFEPTLGPSHPDAVLASRRAAELRVK